MFLLQPYIKGSQLTVRTDNETLKETLDCRESVGQLEMWRLCLVKFGINIEHHADIDHQAAEVISCQPTTNSCEKTTNDDILLLCIVNYDDNSCLFRSDADAYLDLEEDDLFQTLTATRRMYGYSSSPSFSKLRKPVLQG